MKFNGYGIVWDVETNKPLCKFADNVFETEDEDIIDKLKNLGYSFDEKVEKSNIEDKEWHELKKYASEKGVNTHKKSKEEIIQSLKDLEG